MTSQITDVAVAIFLRPDGSFLLSSRPEGKPYPGYWEFPGGKLEPGETVREALVRELIEELNVTITRATPWFTFIMRYTHATVRLHCWRVHAWEGEMHGREGQHFEWQRIDALTVSPTLPGCVPIFKALSLPTAYAISNAQEVGAEAWLAQLDGQLAAGLRLLQIREKTLPSGAVRELAQEAVRRAHAAGARVLINADAELAARVSADGVHLTSAQLAACRERPSFPLVGASTHTRAEIERAGELGLDFVVLGPVKVTRSHPDATPIGWERFRVIADAAPMPVFALGGLVAADMEDAVAHGAHGIAAQRGTLFG
jgi:8-oxo-dGTP diphosphatase